MEWQELSDKFDVLLQSHIYPVAFGSDNPLSFDEYEKSIFLTKAQNEIIQGLYNSTLNSFEADEEIRRLLNTLVSEKTKGLVEYIQSGYGNLYQYTINDFPKTLAIVYEEARLDDNTICNNGESIKVTPVREDELQRMIDNPFRGPNKNRVFRIDISYQGDDSVRLLSKYKLESYTYRYVRIPNPIRPSAFDDNLENEVYDGLENYPYRLWDMILDRAIQLAIASRTKGSNNAQASA